jgi:hypothetical protein
MTTFTGNISRFQAGSTTTALTQTEYIVDKLGLPEGIVLRLRENVRYAPVLQHTWCGTNPCYCTACGLTAKEITDAPETVVCLGFMVREPKK